MSALEIKNLSIRFPGQTHPAVDGISLDIPSGRVLALVGESGSGKSLTALAALRLLPPQAHMTADRLRVQDLDVVHLDARGLRRLRGGMAGMIFQEPLSALNPLHTVEKQISETLFLHQGLSREGARARCLDLLAQVQIPHPETLLGRYPHQLSGGQRQRVMIAMALANRPTLLIADEPTTALDVTIQAEILQLLRGLQKDLQLSVLLITHDLGIVRHYADDLAVMQRGKIVEQGTAQAILAAPQHPYTRHLLDSEPGGCAPQPDLDKPLQLAVDDLNVTFGQPGSRWRRATAFHAVQNASLRLNRGETLGIVGESGSGKSTLALALLRLIESQGEIHFDTQPLHHLRGRQMKPWRARMQVVFQDPWGTLNPRMTIGQIVAEGLKVHDPGRNQQARDERVIRTLEEVGLQPEMRHRYPHEFSGGQRQRIAIARALILKPDLLVLDEPTSALDRSVQHQVLELLQRIQQEHGLSYIFISHDLKVIRSISHHIIVMKDGLIVEQGITEQVFTHPQSVYTRQLIEAAVA